VNLDVNPFPQARQTDVVTESEDLNGHRTWFLV
jgi:hypothetical protein